MYCVFLYCTRNAFVVPVYRSYRSLTGTLGQGRLLSIALHMSYHPVRGNRMILIHSEPYLTKSFSSRRLFRIDVQPISTCSFDAVCRNLDACKWNCIYLSGILVLVIESLVNVVEGDLVPDKHLVVVFEGVLALLHGA